MTDINVNAIPETTDLDLAFGNTKHLPKWEDIPSEFQKDRNKWSELASKLFYEGIRGLSVTPKPGVDIKKALHAVFACLRSYEPKHEHKMAGCGLMLSWWFEDWSTDGDRETTTDQSDAEPVRGAEGSAEAST